MPEGRVVSRKAIVTSTETMLMRETIIKEERIRRVSNVAYFNRDDREPKWEPRAEPLSKKADEFISTLPRRSSVPRTSQSSHEPTTPTQATEELDIEAIKRRMGSLQMLQLGMGACGKKRRWFPSSVKCSVKGGVLTA